MVVAKVADRWRRGGASAGTTLLTDVWGGLTGNGYSGNGGISFTIHNEVETAQAMTEQTENPIRAAHDSCGQVPRVGRARRFLESRIGTLSVLAV